MASKDIIFQLLDIQSKDIRVEHEEGDVKEVVYESADEADDGDDEVIINNTRKKATRITNYSNKEFIIHLFGCTEQGRPLRVDVTGFRPYFYLRLPKESISKAVESIKQYLVANKVNINEIGMKKVMKKVFYGFTANTFYPFLQLDFPSLSMFRVVKGLFLDDKLNPFTNPATPLSGVLKGKAIEVYEANIDPMLRFLHTQNIEPCGWILVKGGLDSVSDDSENNYVIDADYEDILPGKSEKVVAPFLTASWDIECFSITGDFPLAKKTWKKAVKDALHLSKSGRDMIELIYKSLVNIDTLIINTRGNGGSDSDSGNDSGNDSGSGMGGGDNKKVGSGVIGMTPIYCKFKKDESVIKLHTINNDYNIEALDYIVKCGDTYENKVTAAEKLLNKAMKGLIELPGDPVIQIGTTLTRGTADTTERHLFVFPDCDPIDGITIHEYKSEKDMIKGWFDWMIKRDPDILIGYNVFGFDENYMWNRAEELGIVGPTSSIHEFSRLFNLGSEIKCEEKFLSSSALGDNYMYIWTTHGRLQIDLYHYIRRSGASLPSYKLDSVTQHYMSGKLKKYNYSNNLLLLEVAGAFKDVKPGRAIMLLDDTGEPVTDKLTVTSVENNCVSVECSLDEDQINELSDATKWVIVKDDVSPQDIFRLHQESSKGRAIVGKYCLQDCDLVLELYKKLETFNNCMCMANVCSVPISYIFTRGQGIKIESLIFKACKERDILIPVLTAPRQRNDSGGGGSGSGGEGGDGGDDSYEGAIVLDPVPGFYATSPIGVCDFASLYPSTIVSENISHDSLVWVKDYTDDGRLICNYWGGDDFAECSDYAYTDIEFDIWRPDPADTRKHPQKIKCGRRICRYAQPLDGTKSTLPQITLWLLAARDAKKKEMKNEKNPERYALLDAEQLAYKLTGNSLYGQLGSSTFKIRLQSLAASVTAYGRKQILFAKAAIEKFYGPGANNKLCNANVMYGDTDSLFVEFNVKNPETGELLTGRDARVATIDITDEAGAFITKALKKPHDFEFDKAFDPMLMFSKKRYAGNMYEVNADDYVHKYMGIALKRRDNAPIVKTIFGGAMKKLLNHRDVIGAFEFIKKSCMDLVLGKVSLNQLTITKSLRADYADPSRIAHKALADRITARDPGNAPAAGDRIGYVYITSKPGQEVKLQGDKIETPQYVKENNLVPDYQFYVEHQIQNPVSQMFGLLLEQIPGFDKNVLKKCPSDTEKAILWREERAAELLFNDCLKKCGTDKRQKALTNFFGVPISFTKVKSSNKSIGPEKCVNNSGNDISCAAVSVEAPSAQIQSSMNDYLKSKLLVSMIKKNNKDVKAKEEKAKEENSEQNTNLVENSVSVPKKRKRPLVVSSVTIQT